MAEGAPQIREDWAGNQSEPNIREDGDLEAGFAEAAVEVEATYSTAVQTHVCLETHGHVAEWEDEQNLTRLGIDTRGSSGFATTSRNTLNYPQTKLESSRNTWAADSAANLVRV